MGGCGLRRTDTEQDLVARSCERHSESSIPQKRRFFEQINKYKFVKEDPVSRRILINSVCIKYFFFSSQVRLYICSCENSLHSR